MLDIAFVVRQKGAVYASAQVMTIPAMRDATGMFVACAGVAPRARSRD